MTPPVHPAFLLRFPDLPATTLTVLEGMLEGVALPGISSWLDHGRIGAVVMMARTDRELPEDEDLLDVLPADVAAALLRGLALLFRASVDLGREDGTTAADVVLSAAGVLPDDPEHRLLEPEVWARAMELARGDLN